MGGGPAVGDGGDGGGGARARALSSVEDAELATDEGRSRKESAAVPVWPLVAATRAAAGPAAAQGRGEARTREPCPCTHIRFIDFR